MQSKLSRTAPYQLVALFFVLASAIAAVAYRYHVAQKEAIEREVRNQLQSIAAIKVKRLADWHAQQLGVARSILSNGMTMEGLRRAVQASATAAERSQVEQWMNGLCRELHYADAILTDREGNVVIFAGKAFGSHGHFAALARQVIQSGAPVLRDFHREVEENATHLGLNLPLRVAANDPPFGAFLLAIDPASEIYPILDDRAIHSASEESVLVRLEGADVLYLNNIRRTPDSAMRLRIPIDRTQVAAVRAVLGQQGTFEALDYLGIAVFAAALPVPGTPWHLVVKMDRQEVLAPLLWRSVMLGALTLSLICVAGAGVILLWRRQQLREYRERYVTELRFQAAFEQSAVGMNYAALDGRFVRVNQRYCDITGYSEQELLQLRFTDITFPADLPGDSERVRAMLSGESPTYAAEKRYVRKDGSLVWVHVRTSVMRSPTGEPVHFIAVVEDISERLQARHALLQSEERFREVVENAPEGIVVEAGQVFRYVNPAALRLFGASSAAELIGAPILARIHEDDRPAVDALSRSVVSGMPKTEDRLLKLNGEPFLAEVSATPIIYDQQPAALVFFRDLTEEKAAEEERERLEQRLRQAQKMESVGRLAGGVAHDFNNHLTVINGYCDMLLEGLSAGNPMHEEISEIRSAGDRAAVLTQQLLAFSRKQVVEPRPLDLNGVVQEYSKMLGRLLGDDVEVVTSLDSRLGVTMADRGQMHQVLMNLAVNARDAMPGGGRLTIQTSNEDLFDGAAAAAGRNPGRYVVLAVSDTGTGMSPETLQHIFEPFFTTKAVGIGTGLGLSTVYGIVNQTGGFLRVESTPGEGSTFRIYLPQTDSDALSVMAPEHDAPPRGTEVVLVVEDQMEVRKLATGILRKSGYRLLEAANGAEALQLAQGHVGAIDLLLTDVVMPGMTGRELAHRLTALRPAIKVLYISGYTGDVIARGGVLDAETSYLPKPFTPADLARKVREVLGAPPAARVLVIDDDPAVRQMLEALLHSAGYDVLTAENGKAGLALAEENAVRVVITDLVMPEQEGLETLKLFRQRYPQVGLIAISGAYQGDFLKIASMFGAHATFQKPVRPADLLAAVHEILSGVVG